MRTIKALACAAALAAGIATSMAQSNVYSLNVVGYYNITVPANALTIIANQLNTTNNTLAALIPSPAPGSQFFKFTGTWGGVQFDPDDLTWGDVGGATTLNPGEGGFFKSLNAATTLTFVGEVLQGHLANPLPAVNNLGVRSSMVPQAGMITTDLGFPAEGGDQVFKYTGTWGGYQYDPDDLTWGTEPTFGVGEAFYVKKFTTSTATVWTRNFTVQ
jgi:hypothetical protein